jgi:hypothetical protein
LLAEAGLEPERLEMFNLSSAQGARFGEIVTEMSNRLAKLGKSPLRPNRERMEQNVQQMSQEAEALLAGDRK